MLSDDQFGTDESPAPASWSDASEKLGVRALEPAKRLEAFENWQSQTGNYLLEKGELETPEAIRDWKTFELRQKRKLADDFMLEPNDGDVASDLSAWEQIVAEQPSVSVDPLLVRKPEEYRKAVLEAKAPFDLKLLAASTRTAREPEHAQSRRNELTGIVSPHAASITDTLQRSQEMFGIDFRDVSDDLDIQKGEDGKWTIPSSDNITSIGDRISSLMPLGSPSRLSLPELNKFQEKWGLSDDEMRQDFLEAFTVGAPASVERTFMPDKEDLGSLDSRLKNVARVVNKDTGNPSIVVADSNLIFNKKGYDAAVDAADAPDDVKEFTKAGREVLAKQQAPEIFNLLQNNREDFARDYAPAANAAGIGGEEASQKMAETVSKYYEDKEGQGFFRDLTELQQQSVSRFNEGAMRAVALPVSLAGMAGNKKAIRAMGDLSRGFQNTATADQIASAKGSLPTLTKIAGDLAGVLPDVITQVGASLFTSGLSLSAGAARVAKATGVDLATARQALSAAMRSGGDITATRTALSAAKMAPELAESAAAAAKFVTSKDLLKGAAGRQIAAQAGYAGLSQSSAMLGDLYARFRDSGMSEGEAIDKARVGAAVGGGITALITGKFSLAGRGGVEKVQDFKPGQYTVRDIVGSGLWKQMADPEARKLITSTAKTLARDIGDEAMEEGLDQFLQGIAAYATDPTAASQDKTLDQVLDEAGYAGVIGGLAGGGASLARQVAGKTIGELTGDQVMAMEKTRSALRALPESARREFLGADTPSMQRPMAPVAEEVTPEQVAQSLSADTEDEAVETAAAIAPVAPQTAAALAQIAGQPLPQQSSETELGAGAATEPPEASLQVTTPAVEEITQPGDNAAAYSSAPAPIYDGDLGVAPGSPTPSDTTDEKSKDVTLQTPELETGIETGSQPGVLEAAPVPAEVAGIPVQPGVEDLAPAAPQSGEVVPVTPESNEENKRQGRQEVLNAPAAVSEPPAADTPVQQSPDLEVGPKVGESFASAELNSPSTPSSRTIATDVGRLDAAKKPALSGKVKSQSALGKPPENLTPELRKAFDEVGSLTAEFLPAFRAVFKGVDIRDSIPQGKTGGFFYDPSTGKLGLALADVSENLSRMKDKKKWMATAIIEEVIHAVVHKLEKQGKIDSRVLMNAIKKDAPKVYKKIRAAYKTDSDYQAAQEFVRMLAQGKIKFNIGKGITIDGEFTEMQYTDGILRSLKKILEQVLSVIKNLRKNMPKDVAAEMEKAQTLIEDTLREMVEAGSTPPADPPEQKRPPEEEFIWTAEDDLAGTQAIPTAYEKLPKRQADGDGGFLDLYNVVGGPADGTTFAVPDGASEAEVQASANEKTRQFSLTKSQPVGDPRGQEMGVKNLGKERPAESLKAVRQAVRDRIFDASKAEPANPDDYQTAHDLARTLTGGGSEDLKELRDLLEGHPALENLPKQLVSLAAVIYGELTRFAGRLAVEGGVDGVADLSFLATLVNGYNNLSEATVKLLANDQQDEGTSVITEVARLLGSMKEVSEPFGLILKHFKDIANQGYEELRRRGLDHAQVQALAEHITNPEKSKGRTDAVDTAINETPGIEKVDAELEKIQKKRKPRKAKEGETDEEAKDEGTDEQDAEEAIEELIDADVDKSLEAKVRKIMARHAANDTWTRDKTPAETSALEKLAMDHLKAPVVNFTEQAQELGVDADSAADLDRAISSTRNSRATVKKYREENPNDKAKDRAIASLLAKFGPRSRKVATVKDIMQAMDEHPSLVGNPAFRKAVVKQWLELQGIDTSRMKLGELDTLIATVFADAQARRLKDFVGKLNDEQKDPEKKIQPTEIQKIAKALRTGMITGAPVEWQTAFTEKFGMRALTPQETQEVLKYSSIVGDDSYAHHDRIVASGKLAAIFRQASGNPDWAHLLAASYTQSALTGISTQSLQFTQGAVNWMSRIYEDIAAGALTGKGVKPIINAVRAAFDTYKRSFGAALINDNYREAQFVEISKLTALRTAWERSVEEFGKASKLRKAALLPKLILSSQDFFRRLMSSADDAAVSGIKAYVSGVEQQSLLRKAGIKQSEIDKMLEVSREHLETLDTEEAWKANRPDYSWSNYRAWAMDVAQSNLRDAIQEALAVKYAAQGLDPKKAGEAIKEIDTFSTAEAEADVGVGTARDEGSKWDVLQFFGEEIISHMEKKLRLNPKDRGAKAAIKYLFWRMLLGFLRTPFNAMSRAVYRGPLGLYRLAVTGAIVPGKFSERAAALYSRTMGSARQQAKRRQEAMVWTLTMATLTALTKALQGDEDDPEDDVIRINGQGPEDTQARDAWRAAGHQPNSIELNVGDAKISVPFGRSGLENLKPGLMMLSALDDMRLNGLATGEPETLLNYAVSYGKGTLYNASMFGLKNIANMRQDYATGNNKLTKQVAYMASPFLPFSGFIKSIGRMAYPGKADDKTLRGAIATSTPFFWIGEKAYNLYGQPAYGTPSSTIGKITGNAMWGAGWPFSVDIGKDKPTMDVYKFSMDTGLAPSSPTRESIDKRLLRLDPKHSPMSDAEWVKYWKAAGEERLKSMKQFVPRAGKMPENLINRNLDVINTRAHNAGTRALK
jgi:hypothetical protein